MPQLVLPSVRFHRSFVAAMAEDPGIVYLPSGPVDDLRQPTGFAAYVSHLRADACSGSPRPEGFVPGTTLWWAEGDEVLGRVAVRHRLTERLRAVGGHIGYFVRPSARGRGHATRAFRAALPVAAGLGIDPALVTCDDDNVASRRIIEGAGGVLDDQEGGLGGLGGLGHVGGLGEVGGLGDEGRAKLRYWVPTRTVAAG